MNANKKAIAIYIVIGLGSLVATYAALDRHASQRNFSGMADLSPIQTQSSYPQSQQ